MILAVFDTDRNPRLFCGETRQHGIRIANHGHILDNRRYQSGERYGNV